MAIIILFTLFKSRFEHCTNVADQRPFQGHYIYKYSARSSVVLQIYIYCRLRRFCLTSHTCKLRIRNSALCYIYNHDIIDGLCIVSIRFIPVQLVALNRQRNLNVRDSFQRPVKSLTNIGPVSLVNNEDYN